MRKTIAILLTLALMAGLFVIPAAAAVNAAVNCPYCRGTELENLDSWNAVYSSSSVTSCDYYSGSHTHVKYKLRYSGYCVPCERNFEAWGNGSASTFCGASNMWLGIDIVDQIM